MSESKDLKEFPDLSNKLAAPAKKSLFERQRAEAEAKRLREEAETAAVYADFVKSFDDEGPKEPASTTSRARGGFIPEPRVPTGPPKRHFTSALRNSGPGTLDGETSSLARKIGHEGSRANWNKEKALFGFEDSQGSGIDAATAFKLSDAEDEKAEDLKSIERAAPKPTLQLSSMPPGTSPSVIKSLLPSNLVVDSVRIMPPSGPGSSNSTERKSMSAIVTFAKDTPASDLDVAVSALQHRYLGWGYNLSLSRHLSSAALGSNASSTILHASTNSLPFGAQNVPADRGPSLSRAPPPGMHKGGYAPPSSYDQGAYGRSTPAVQVKVSPPSDIRQLKLIHKTLENLIKHGPEFEALLMSRPEVQREEKWAWLWNSRSPGGVWYRWRLWGLLTGSDSRLSDRSINRPLQKLFDGGAPWVEADEILPFEFATNFDQFISDSDYNSSDEDDSGDEKQDRARRRYFQGTGGAPPDVNLASASEEPKYLNPLHKAKLTHLLARLPTTTAKLRKGDVARVTAFAISHAGQGADEVVDMIISNVISPYSRSRTANPESKREEVDSEDEMGNGEDKQEQKDLATSDDISSSTLVALHLISDILSASSTSGVRHAWRFRSLFESCFQSSNVFAYLGRMEKAQGWGRLRAEKWRRSIAGVFQLWEGWCVFPAVTHAKFLEDFNHPPLTATEAAAEQDKKVKKEGKDGPKSKWKSVAFNPSSDIAQTPAEQTPTASQSAEHPSIRNNPRIKVENVVLALGDTPSVARSHDQPIKNVIVVSEKAETNMAPSTRPDPHTSNLDNAPATTKDTPMSGISVQPVVPAKRRRPKAEDMFADSDGE